MSEGLAHLDGLRGVLALLVMISHIAVFLPVGELTVGHGPAGHLATAE